MFILFICNAGISYNLYIMLRGVSLNGWLVILSHFLLLASEVLKSFMGSLSLAETLVSLMSQELEFGTFYNNCQTPNLTSSLVGFYMKMTLLTNLTHTHTTQIQWQHLGSSQIIYLLHLKILGSSITSRTTSMTFTTATGTTTRTTSTTTITIVVASNKQ